METCDWCGYDIDEPIAVGIAHAASGPGRNLYACRPCKEMKRLLPLDQHPAHSLGFPRCDYAATVPARMGGMPR